MTDLPKDLTERLRTALTPMIDNGSMPGLTALVARGEDQHVLALGTQAFDDPTPMAVDTIFRIASITKPVASACAMTLVQDGTLGLDAPVDPFLPELANRQVLRTPASDLDDTVPAKRPISLRDLMALSMGHGFNFTSPTPLAEAARAAGVAAGPDLPAQKTGDDYMAALGTLPLKHQPGEGWAYDTGLRVLGILLERTAGKPFALLMAERIFEPLGMADAGFWVPEAKANRLAAAYRGDAEGKPTLFDAGGRASRFIEAGRLHFAASGMVCTALDYLAFARMMLAKGAGPTGRVLAEASVAQMQCDQISPEAKAASPWVPGFWETSSWGLGLGIELNPKPGAPRGCGWVGGYGASAHWDPQDGTIAILMTQRLLDGPQGAPALTAFWKGMWG